MEVIMRLFRKKHSAYQQKEQRADDMANNLRHVQLNNEIDLEDDVEFATAIDGQERYGHLQGETIDTRNSSHNNISRGSDRMAEPKVSEANPKNWTNSTTNRESSDKTNPQK
jgi:hypothetical protein